MDTSVHYGMDSSVLKHRAAHQPLAVDEVRNNGTRKVGARVVVVPTRAVIDELENLGLWEAFADVYRAFKIMTAGLGVKTCDPSRVAGGCGDIEDGAELLQKYYLWHEECKSNYKSPLMVRQMMVEGWNFDRLEKEYKFKHGSAKKNLVECLEIWNEI